MFFSSRVSGPNYVEIRGNPLLLVLNCERRMRGDVHVVCCTCWPHRTHYAFRILHRSPTLILDTLKQDARKYFIHAHGVSGRRMFVFFVVGDGAALAEWCYWRLQPKAVIESNRDVAALAAELKKKSFCQA